MVYLCLCGYFRTDFLLTTINYDREVKDVLLKNSRILQPPNFRTYVNVSLVYYVYIFNLIPHDGPF